MGRKESETLGSGFHMLFLGLGMVALFNLLFSRLPLSLSAEAVAAVGEGANRLLPLTQGASMDGFGAWSPNGQEIAFMRDGQILLTDPAGKKSRVLTSVPEHWDADPVWRPDGKALAFIRLSMQGDQSRVMLLDPGQGSPKEVARDPSTIGYLAWSPDGRSLFYSTRDQIHRVDSASGKKEEVFAAPKGWELLSGGLAVTKDGQALVFGGGPQKAEGVQYDLWRLPLRPKATHERLTTEGGIMPALDPTGRLVAYRNPRQPSGIYLLNLATRATERILPDGPKAMYFHPSFSPDGRRLLLSRLLLSPAPARNRGGFTSNLYLFTPDP